MALDPVQSLAAAALRLETEGAASLAQFSAGETFKATVVAALSNGGFRLSLVDLLFTGTGSTADGAAKAPSQAPSPQGPAPDGATPPEDGTPRADTRRAVERRLPQMTEAAPRQPPGVASRSMVIDLPPGLRLSIGDTVRLTVVENAPALALRVEAEKPPGTDTHQSMTIAIQSPRVGGTSPSAPGVDPTLRTGVAAPLPEAEAPLVPAPRDRVTLSPEATRATRIDAALEPPESPADHPPLTAPARAAVAAMIPKAAAAQQSLAPLAADLKALATSPVLAALPQPLREAVTALARSFGVDAATLDGPTLQRAIERAGPFLESRLTRLVAKPDATPERIGAVLANDTKAQLLGARQAIATFLGDEPIEQAAPDRPPPPRRGLAPLGQPAALPLLPLTGEPREAVRHLAGAIEGALDRIRLQQAAALPEDTPPDVRSPQPSADRLVELPLRLPTQTPIAAFSIGPDGRAPKPGEPSGWRMRLSLDLAESGRIDGLVAVRGRTTSITLRAASADTAALLQAGLPELRRALAAADLDIETIDLHEGIAPAAAPTQARSGSFLDKRS